MKLMTLNAWQGRLERVLLKHLEQQNLDFACMQEVVDYEGKTGGLISSYSKIGASLRLDQHFFSPLNTLKFGNRSITFGNIIYSNLPFEQSETIFTRGQYKDDFDFDVDDYNIRALQHTAVKVGDKKLHILNHHGHHIDAHKLGDEETMRQTALIIEYIKQLDGAVILCGDFNLSPESESIKLFDSILQNLSVAYALETTRSLLTYKKEVCDYIFVNNDVDVKGFSMDETIISDHNALILDFEIK
ncbi:MAG TPA: endonuclease/exonuclease/phosphatase family protein [Candidatus Saccharimonadales bacterium]